MASVDLPILSLLFWNMRRAPRFQILQSLCLTHQIDLAVIAEPPKWGESTDPAFRQFLTQFSLHEGVGTQRLRLFHRSDRNFAPDTFYIDDSGRLVMTEFTWNCQRFNLAAAHLMSPSRTELDDRNAEATIIADCLRHQEASRSNSRTILMGDLNLNPFDRGVAQAAGFQGMMAKSSIVNKVRTVQTRKYPYFYNPMWGNLGDRTPGPPGTFYYRKGSHLGYDWHMCDQVLLRPEVLDLADDQVEIVDKCLDVKLVDHLGRPDRKVGSDHLPVLLTLRWKD